MSAEDALIASLNQAREMERKEKLESKDEKKTDKVPSTLVDQVEHKPDYAFNELWNIADPNDPQTNSFGIHVVTDSTSDGYSYWRLMCYWLNGRPKNASLLTRPVAENMKERICGSTTLPPLQNYSARCGAAGNLIVDGDVKSKMYTKDIRKTKQFVQFDGLAEDPSHADPSDAGLLNADNTPKLPRDKLFLMLIPLHNERQMMWVISHVWQDKIGNLNGLTKQNIDKYMEEESMPLRVQKHLAAVREKQKKYAATRSAAEPVTPAEKMQKRVRDVEHCFGFSDALLTKEATVRALYERMLDADKVTITMKNQQEKDTKKVLKKTEMLRLFSPLVIKPKKALKTQLYSGSKRRAGQMLRRKGAKVNQEDVEAKINAQIKAMTSYKNVPADPKADSKDPKAAKEQAVAAKPAAGASASASSAVPKKIDISGPGEGPATTGDIAPYQPGPVNMNDTAVAAPLSGVTLEDTFKKRALEEGLAVKRVKVFELGVSKGKDGKITKKEVPIAVDLIDSRLTGDAKIVVTYRPAFYINGDKERGTIGTAHQLISVTIVRAESANKRPRMVAPTGLLDDTAPDTNCDGLDEFEDATESSASSVKYDRPLVSENGSASGSGDATETDKRHKAHAAGDAATAADSDVASMDGATASELSMEHALKTAENMVATTDVSTY